MALPLNQRVKPIFTPCKHIKVSDISDMDVRMHINDMRDWDSELFKHTWGANELLDSWLRERGVATNELVIYET